MKVISLDLNTNCTGVFGVGMKAGRIEKAMSASILVNDFKVKDHFPFMESKKKLPSSENGHHLHNTYFKKGETHVSKTEKKRRDREVRHKRNRHQIDAMAKNIADVVRVTNSDLVLIEKNAMFNGILTIELLSKLHGTVIGICRNLGVEYLDFSVQEVRSPYNIPRLVKEFSKTITPERLAGLPDVSKAAIRWHLQKIYSPYGVRFQTDDESDAALVFDYWNNYIRKK